jgi:TonB-dependent SusC/RagA subfamily outer membrane receptor
MCVVACLALLAAPSLAAQAGGSVTGRIVDARSQAPLSVQVYLLDTGMGTMTDDEGEFVLVNVPPRGYSIQVRRIGYGSATQEITVIAGQTTTVNFALVPQALGLDEIVVTGTAGAARRREIGNTIAQINLADLPEPVRSVNDIMQGRSAGVTMLQTTGQVGGGASIRLRGNISAAMSNQPLIYVDGVRLHGEAFPKNAIPFGYQGGSSNTQYSPLNDINPADIERVEVIKGPAATTLYGTEAASGVIQIFTKAGQPGGARFTLQTDQGFAHVNKFGPTVGFDGEPLVVPPNEINPFGTPDFMYLEPWLRNAWRQKYSASVGGGMQDLQYFVSASWTDEDGVLPNDQLKQASLRGNVSFAPTSGLQVQWNTGYTRTRNRKTPVGGTSHGITLNAFRRDRNYFNSEDPDEISQVLEFDLRDYIDHITSSVVGTYSPTSTLTNRITIGFDLAEQETRGVQPFDFYFVPLGQIWDTRWQTRTVTADYVGSLNLGLSDNINSTVSWGGQSVSTETTRSSAYSKDFPGPGDPTVNSGALSLGFEERERVINAGLFVQNVFAFKDRYFLTVGLRADGNSAFGTNLGIEAYPKVSASYVISDEPFWISSLGSVKLRAAWGQSGRAPGAFDAVRTWSPESWGTQVSFLPNNVGNADLGPERSSELELGFDASLLNDRVSVDFTYYRQKTTDALFSIQQIPTDGGFSSQLQNVGALQNRGIEITTDVAVIEKSNFGWTLGGTISTNHSKVLEGAPDPGFSVGNRGSIIDGQPVPVMRRRCIMNPDEVADPVIEQLCNIGPNRPTLTLTVSNSLRLPRGMMLSARGEYQGGHYAYSLMDGESITRGIRWPACFNSYPAIDAGDISSLTARERAMCIATNANRDFAIFPMDFFRFRELTFSAPLGFLVPQASSVRISLSAQNFKIWKKADDSYLDPETSGGFSSDNNVGQNARTHTVGGSIPIPARFVASFRIQF